MSKSRNGKQHPLFGKAEKYRGTVKSMDEKWHVRLYDVDIYFLGFRIASYVDERVIKGPVTKVS